MPDVNTVTVRSGPSSLFIFFLALFVLKVSHVVNWSWWLVCLPLYAGVAFVILLTVGSAILITLAAGIGYVWDTRKRRARRKAHAKWKAQLAERKNFADKMADARRANYNKTYSKYER